MAEGPALLAYEWPDEFPADCPPATAEVATGLVYRIVSGDPPNRDDFRSSWAEYPGRTYVEKQVPAHGVPIRIRAHGTSVCRELQDSRNTREHFGKFSARFRNGRIAVGTLDAQMGKTQLTASGLAPSHTDWWIPKNVDPSGSFQVVP